MKFVKIFAVAAAAVVAIVWLVLQVFKLTRENAELEEQNTFYKNAVAQEEPEKTEHEETKQPDAQPGESAQ